MKGSCPSKQMELELNPGKVFKGFFKMIFPFLVYALIFYVYSSIYDKYGFERLVLSGFVSIIIMLSNLTTTIRGLKK